MVKLNKIYTRGGDGGQTSLADGTRIDKHTPRMTAQGDVDEANATIGLARSGIEDEATTRILMRVQNDMFDLGADITTPGDGSTDGAHALRIRPVQVTLLETEIDAITAGLAPLESFVLRGGPNARWRPWRRSSRPTGPPWPI
jgi:cob(I)alamin adenosyltransferase